MVSIRIDELEKMREIMSGLIESCSEDKIIGKCPILNVMTGEDAK